MSDPKPPRGIPSWAYQSFLRIAEPRVVRLMQFCIYVVTVIGGVSAWVSPPNSIEGVLGGALTSVWAVLLVLGGVLGLSSVLRGVWWLERAGVAFCATGLLMYAVVVASLQLSQTGSRIMQLCVIVIALFSFGIRWVRIRRYPYDPEK